MFCVVRKPVQTDNIFINKVLLDMACYGSICFQERPDFSQNLLKMLFLQGGFAPLNPLTGALPLDPAGA